MRQVFAKEERRVLPLPYGRGLRAAETMSRLLHGEHVDLRAIEEADFALLHRWANDPAMVGEYDILRPVSLDDIRRRYRDNRALTAEGGALLIVRKDEVPVGTVSCHPVSYGVYSPAFNIGIEIEPAERGQGFGSEAQRLFADYLLSTFPVGRVEASTDIENAAEQRALERAGFTREGVARSASWRGGRWHDMVVFSRVQGNG
jgi:RimJ/RimL family protein N-acetyltransferase